MSPGGVIAERYELLEAVGRGGMGVVYRALDRQTGSLVAVKLVPAAPHTAKRFAREAHVLAQLEHPGVVRYVADGKVGRARRFLVMEWLEGEDLEARLDRARLTVPEAVELGRQVADALAAVHALDVIHRDLKPGNIFLVDRDIAKAKVLDFGIAHVAATLALTQTGVTLGTPAYMSPEQVRRGPLGPRADLFALGSVLFECLVGRPPFVGASAVQVMQQVLRERAPDVRQIRADVPRELASLVDQLLAKEPEDRPEDARAVAAALGSMAEALAHGAPPSAEAPLLLGDDEQVFVALIVREPAPRESRVTLVDAVPETRPAAAIDPSAASVPQTTRAYGAVSVTLAPAVPALVLPQQGSTRELAVRSARCALELRARHPTDRVGLVMGHAQLEDATPVGDIAQRAAEVVEGAQPGELRVDAVTAGLLPPRFVVYADGRRHSLVREDPLDPPARMLGGRVARFVGREEELTALERTLGASLEGAPAGALVVGESGVGKSRLAFEATERLRARAPHPLVWMGRASAADAPYGLIASWLREGAGVQLGHRPEQAERALRAIVALHCAAEEVDLFVAFLGVTVGLDIPAGASAELDAARADPHLMRGRVRYTVLTFLEQLARSRPVVLCAEDLHAVDRPSLELVATLARMPDVPVAVLATADRRLEPEVSHELEAAGFERLVLGPLPHAVLRAVAAEQRPDASDDALDRVVERAHGNPYFLEQLLHHLESSHQELPESVLSVARERFEALPGFARRVLRAASVYGARFTPGGVRALLGPDVDSSEVEGWLATLTESGLIGWDPERTDAEPVYRFLHEVQREAVYAALTPEDRSVGHLLAARWLMARDSTAAVRLAMHYEQAERPDLARIHHARAAEEALSSLDFDAALTHADAALATDVDPQLRGRMQLVKARAWHIRGDREAAGAFAEAALAEDLEPLDYCRAARVLVAARKAQGLDGDAAELARTCFGRARREDLSDAAWTELLEMGQVVIGGAGRDVADEIIALADRVAIHEQLQDPNARAALAGLKGRRAMLRGDIGGYLDRARERRELQARAGNARGVCWSDGTIGWLLVELGAYAEAEHVIRAGGAAARQLGLSGLIAQADHNLGLCLAYLGRAAEGAACERAAVAAFEALGERRMAIAGRLYLAKILLVGGDRAAAAVAAAEAGEAAQRSAPSLMGACAAVRGRVHLELGEPAEALATLTRAPEWLAAGMEAGEAELRLVWGEALRANGHDEEALDVIREANARLLERASKIDGLERRRSFLERVPENARTVALYAEWTR